MTFWMFLSKERNSVKADRFLLWDNVVSMYHIDIVILWTCRSVRTGSIKLSWASPDTIKKETTLWACGYSIPCSSSHAVCVDFFFFLPSSLFLFLTFIYLLLLEVVYIFETMLTLHLLIKLYLNKLHMLITE